MPLLSSHCCVNGTCKVTNFLMLRFLSITLSMACSNNNSQVQIRSMMTAAKKNHWHIDPYIITKSHKMLSCSQINDWCPRSDEVTCPQRLYYCFAHFHAENSEILINVPNAHWMVAASQCLWTISMNIETTRILQWALSVWMVAKNQLFLVLTVNIVVFCSCNE